MQPETRGCLKVRSKNYHVRQLFPPSPIITTPHKEIPFRRMTSRKIRQGCSDSFWLISLILKFHSCDAVPLWVLSFYHLSCLAWYEAQKTSENTQPALQIMQKRAKHKVMSLICGRQNGGLTTMTGVYQIVDTKKAAVRRNKTRCALQLGSSALWND